MNLLIRHYKGKSTLIYSKIVLSFWCKTLSSSKSMEGSSRKNIIAVCQMTASKCVSDNLETVSSLVKAAKQNKAKMVFLPEACDYIGDHPDDTVGMSSTLDSEIVNNYCALASESQMWLSIGGIHEKISNNKIHNAHLIINDKGQIVSVYRKIHLYDVDLPEKNIKIQESAATARGDDIVPPVECPIGKVGLSICYDLRFPEISLSLTKMGAEVLTFPSAFMKATGEAHWETLLRARAIECQAYVVAAAQVGPHNAKRTSWGHAMIVDPWGTILAECDEECSIAYAEINLDFLQDVRKQMPLWEQRRNDLYPILIPYSSKKVATGSSNIGPSEKSSYKFGQATVTANTVFYKTDKSIAFTNKKCVVPGHVLVAPIRSCKRMIELSPEEVADMFITVQKVQSVMERVHNVSSSTITVQDGEHAGQTINHVHVHVLPRRPGDFVENDQIYYELQKHDKPGAGNSWRSEEEMAEEASSLRVYF